MSGSIKEIVRVLGSRFSETTVSYPLPEDFEQPLEQFVHAHNDIDDSDSQRIHEELLAVYNKHVTGNSEKQSPFVAVLRLLRPLLIGEKRLDEWWTLVIRPTVDTIGHRRDTIEDAKEFLLGILVFDVEDDASGYKSQISTSFVQKLLEAYLLRTKIPTGDDVVSPEDEFIAHELEGILVSFGRKMPKKLLLAIDNLFIIKDRRLQALSLLSSFVRLQPPHLHLVLETKVIKHLHTCLLLDNSSTVVHLALTILIMFIPHITSTLVSDLPTLFIIYSRVLCWDHYNKQPDRSPTSEKVDSDSGSDHDSFMTFDTDSDWDRIDTAVDGEQYSVPKANYLFTFLYGLFPLNFMNFIRKPRRYLKMKGHAQSDNLDLHQDLIRTRTEGHRSQHRLHPNFFNTTPEDELADNKWIKSDPAELVSECLGLCIAVNFTLSDPGPPPTAKLPALPRKLRKQPSRATIPPGDEDTLGLAISPIDDHRSNSNRNTLSTTLTAHSSVAYTTMEPLKIPPRQSSHPSLLDHFARASRNVSPHGDTVDSPTEFRPTTPRRINTTSAPPSPPRSMTATPVNSLPKLQSFAQTLSRFPVPSPDVPGGDVYNTAILQRELMVLRNELTWEKFQKQKYLEQIGHLQRKNMNDGSVETDTQSLMNKNRALKAKVGKQDERYEQLKKEMAQSRSQAKKYEDQLTTKVRLLKEEEKQWQMENDTLRHELTQARKECEELKKMIVESEQRETHSQNELGTLQLNLEEMNNLRSNLYEMSNKIREYEHRDLEFARAQEQHQVLQSELETARLKLNSSDAERERMRIKYEQKLFQLESASRNGTPPGSIPGQTPPMPSSVQQMLDSALAASQSKIGQLKKQYAQLQHRYLDLELRNQELEGNGPRPGSVLSLTRFADDSLVPPSGTSSARDSFIAGSVPARSRSSRRHDFASAGKITEEGAESPIEQQFTSAGLALFPTSAPSSRHPSDLALHASNLEREYAEYGGMHDFQVGSPPGETMIQTMRMGSDNKPHVEPRLYGRGGAGNVSKKTKEKEVLIDRKKIGKASAFRNIKGIM